jgi:ubiquinone/menaquinone biosynthesis C-methylase UbiE
MNIRKLQRNWNEFGRRDPLWSILTDPAKKGNQWDLKDFFETGVTEIEGILREVRVLLPSMPSQSALDFGCGIGRLTQALAMHFDSVAGVDIAPSMIALAEKYNRFQGKVEYHLNFEDKLSMFADQKFDFIYSSIVLQHMNACYIKAYLTEFLRTLKNGGVLVFQLPSHRHKKGNSVLHRIVRRLLKEEMLEKVFRARVKLGSLFSREPLMEMYGIKKIDVVQFLEEKGALMLDVRRDCDHGVWESYIYFVRK